MQGIWKEKIGGYNAKDKKRKKQTRKHTLKDKMVGLMSVGYRGDKTTDKYKVEPNVVDTRYYTDKGVEVDPVYIIFIVNMRYKKDYRNHKEGYTEYEEKEFRIYFENSQDIISAAKHYPSGQSITDYLGVRSFFNIKKDKWEKATDHCLKRKFDVQVQWLKEVGCVKRDMSNMFKKENDHSFYWLEEKLMVYNKEVKAPWRYYKRPSNKFSKKTGSKIIRTQLRNYISKERFDLCAKEQYHRGYHWF